MPLSNFTKSLARLTLVSLVGITLLVSGGNLVAQQAYHNNEILKTFTEPIEKSVAAGPEIGIVVESFVKEGDHVQVCLLYTSPSPRDATLSRMPSSA